MAQYEYKLKVSADSSLAEKILSKFRGEQEGNTINIPVNFDGSSEDLIKQLRKLASTNDVTIEVKYALAKSSLDAIKANISRTQLSMDIAADATKAQAALEDAYNKLKTKAQSLNIDMSIDADGDLIGADKLNKSKELKAELQEFAEIYNKIQEVAKSGTNAGITKYFNSLTDDANALGLAIDTTAISIEKLGSWTFPKTNESSLNKSKALMQELETEVENLKKQLGIDSTGSNGFGDKTVKVNLDTTQFDSELARVKKELDSLDVEKTIKIKTDADKETNSNDTANDITDYTLPRYASVGTVMHGSEETVSHINGDEYKSDKNAVITRVSRNDTFSLALSNLKSEVIENGSLAEALGKASNEIEEAFGEALRQKASQIPDAFRTALKSSRIDSAAIDKAVADFADGIDDSIDADFTGNEVTSNLQESIQYILKKIGIKLDDAIQNEILARYDDELTKITGIDTEKQYQAKALSIINSAENLKDVNVPAATVTPHAVNTQSVQAEEQENTDAKIKIQPSNVSDFREEIQKQLDALDPVNVNAAITNSEEIQKQLDNTDGDANAQARANVTIPITPSNISQFRETIQTEISKLAPVDVKVNPVADGENVELDKVTIKPQTIDDAVPVPINVAIATDIAEEIKKKIGNTPYTIDVEVAPTKKALDAISDAVADNLGAMVYTDGNGKKHVENKVSESATKARKDALKQQKMLEDAYAENDAFDKLKAEKVVAINPNESFVKQWNTYQKQQEAYQKDLSRQQAAAEKAAKKAQESAQKAAQKQHDKQQEYYDKLFKSSGEYDAYNQYKELTGKSPRNDTNRSYASQLESAQKAAKRDNEKAQTKLNNISIKLDDIDQSKYIDTTVSKITELKQKVASLNDHPINIADPDDKAQLDAIIDDADKLFKELKSPDNKIGSSIKLNSVLEELYSMRDNWSGASSATADKISAAIADAEKMAASPNTSDAEIKDAIANVRALRAEIINAGENVQSFWGLIGDRLKGINAQFIAQFFSFQDWIRYIRAAADNVISLNTALSELRKVSDASVARLNQSFETSAETAKELGNTVSSVINMTADWARLGYNVGDAEQLARITTLFKNVADGISTDEASSYLISTLKGFELDTSEAEHIVDVYNELGNLYAIDSGGVGAALQRSAASLNAANTSFEKSAALVTATNEIVQDPEAVGNMWKTKYCL